MKRDAVARSQARKRDVVGPFRGAKRVVIACFAMCLATSCRQDMHDQPRYEPLEKTSFFADGRSSRPEVAGTVARGRLEESDHLYRGTIDGKPADAFPFAVTPAVLARGRDRFEIYCTPCHGRVGDGDGMVVERGMRRPPSHHIERLRLAPPGYVFDVITKGFGAMYDYADRIAPEDRWAVAAYVRVLQRSQNATIADVPSEERAKLAEKR